MNSPAASPKPAAEFVNLKIDGQSVRVPKGTNVIEAARSIGIEIPYYCYHPDLSIAGNCRMCQCEVKGQGKLAIACNQPVAEGMEVATQKTSQKVADAQASTLEFILINHPLDCTVCDQAGHCKLQDFHYDYNARPSRFLENKEHKVKAEPLGPTVMLDGERCIMCTRCVRFCDEVTGTSELGMLNRGDRSVIAINPGKELNNPLSGTVVDLCPVGALTHREWRFNTRIWFTKQTDSICPGCSTGCNVKVAVRDKQVVQVKARHHELVNKEWLCDEGRYGFARFLPQHRVTAASVRGSAATLEAALDAAKALAGGPPIVFLAPDLLTEEYTLLKKLIDRSFKGARVAVAYRERKLTPVEAKLISPDYAANFRGAEFSGVVSGDLAQGYTEALHELRTGVKKHVLLIGDAAILKADIDMMTLGMLSQAASSVAVLCDADSQLASAAQVVLPGRSILERSGLLVNRARRLQYSDRVVDFPAGSEPAWRIINGLAERLGGKLTSATADRELTNEYLTGEPRLKGLSIGAVKRGGIDLANYAPGEGSTAVSAAGAPA